MKRREFLAALGAGAAAAVVPALAPVGAGAVEHIWQVTAEPNPLFSGEIGTFEGVRFIEEIGIYDDVRWQVQP